MPTISQGLTLPANVVTNGTIQPSDVSTLYATMNAFNIPSSFISPFVTAYSTGSAQTIVGPATSTAGAGSGFFDQTISAAATKAVFHLGSYSWSSTGVATLGLQFRKNATAFTAAQAFATSTAGSGAFFVIHGPHDATAARPVLGFLSAGSTGGFFSFAANADLANAAWTSIGVAVTGTTSTASGVTLNYVRVFAEA